MRRKTCKNFSLAMDILMDVGLYSQSEAYRLARQAFRDAEADRGKGNRSADWFLAQQIERNGVTL